MADLRPARRAERQSLGLTIQPANDDHFAFEFPGVTSGSVVIVSYAMKGDALEIIGVTQPASPVEQMFDRLALQWQVETMGPSSSLTDIVTSPAYLRIIALGWQAVPLILKKLEREPDHWGVALDAITGASPVAESAEGDIEAIAHAWLEWGRSRHLI